MTRVALAAIASSTIIAILAVRAGERAEQGVRFGSVTAPVVKPAAAPAHGSLYGRVTVKGGAVYEGRLRFGGDEEALWSNYFNGVRRNNPWMAYAPRDVAERRPFMTRFGDIVRIEPRGRDLLVTLKSGTVVNLARYEADDFADGVRVWDDQRGVVDLGERQIRSIEFLPESQPGSAAPLYGTVRTKHGTFTGFIQWNRRECLSTDVLDGQSGDGTTRLPFASIRSIARRSPASAAVTLLDGRELVLSGTREVGEGHGGIYVDDARYGRVLVSWDAFQQADFAPANAIPAYADYAPGRALTGAIVTRSGARHEGRLVFDLDESETTETLDAPLQGVDYTIPFSLIASIEQGNTVKLHTGEQLVFERSGDLGSANGGMLVFVQGRARPVYVPWSDIAQVRFDR